MKMLISNRAFFLSLLFLVIALAGVAKISSRGIPRVVQTNLENLPMQIGDYNAVKDDFSAAVYEELNADKHVYRHYRKVDGSRIIDLYIGYYGTAKGGRTAHNPGACLPGAGWGIINNEKVALELENLNRQEQVNYVTARKDGTYNLILHWYQASGAEVLGTGLEQNIHRLYNLVFKNRNDGAFIQISSNAQESQIQETFADIKEFAEKILVLLPDYWPEERFSQA